MTWINTVRMDEDERVKTAIEDERKLYPVEYATPVHPVNNGETSGIVASHTLIPDALFHAFSTLRNDCNDGIGNEPLPLLNRVARRVSAPRHVERGDGRSPEERLPVGAHQRAGPRDAGLRRETDERRDEVQS